MAYLAQAFFFVGVLSDGELQGFGRLLIHAVPSIVDNEQTLCSIMLADELADVLVELVLWLLSYIQFDRLGLVVKAFAEEGCEFSGL